MSMQALPLCGSIGCQGHTRDLDKTKYEVRKYLFLIKPWLILTILAGIVLPASAQTTAKWQSWTDAWSEAAASDLPALVYVRAAWCSPCRKLERETFSDPAVELRLRRFAQARLTIDDFDSVQRLGAYRLSEAAWAARIGAESTPALIVLAPGGAILARHSGYVPARGLVSILDAALAELAELP